MSEQEKGIKKGWISRFSKKIDDALRFGDFRSNRTAGSFLDEKLGIPHHSWHYIVLPALVAAIIVMGVPEFTVRLFVSCTTFVAVLFILIPLSKLSISRKWTVYTEMLLQIGVILVVCAIVWTAGGHDYTPGICIYRNFFVLAALIISATLISALFFSHWVWKRVRRMDTYRRALKKTELFMSRGKTVIDASVCGLIRAFFTVAPGAPLQLLLIPAFFALIVPRDLLLAVTIPVLAACYLILFLGGMDPRLNYTWCLLQKVFFRGAALIVSLVIIALAAMRLFDVTYVSTVFDTAQGITIALILACVYILLWWHDYWVNRLLAQELLKLLGGKNAGDGKIPYAIDPDSVKTSVLPNGRVLQVHGASRFIVIGKSPKYPHEVFQAHEFNEMFTLMATSAFPGGKAELSPAHINERILDFKYFMVLAFLFFSIGTGLSIHLGPQQAQLEADTHGTPKVRLAQLLDDPENSREDGPAFVVAASGGGTRAALYTAAVLEGLASQGRVKGVILGSGVSGGGAALAYFAGQRNGLMENDGWDEYFKKMSQPFIRDVLNGALQWRIVAGTRLGVLLSESFKDRWRLDSVCELGQVEEFGLILNTAIAGRQLGKENTLTDMAGGRLILTNLALGKNFATSVETIGGPEDLPVVVDDPDIRLEVAAALNANFPPIFSNAAIDIDKKTRYWVTDGGAVDNRGIEMMLYALLEALKEIAAVPSKALPAVNVVVADASSFSNRYSQDRGLGTMMSAGTQYASLLVAEQVLMIKELYSQKKQPNDFKYIYLPMPLCLRESGSFGTHWMLQPNIEINIGSDKSKKIKGLEMIALLRAMHSSDKDTELSPAGRAVLAYAMSDAHWHKGAKALGLIEE